MIHNHRNVLKVLSILLAGCSGGAVYAEALPNAGRHAEETIGQQAEEPGKAPPIDPVPSGRSIDTKAPEDDDDLLEVIEEDKEPPRAIKFTFDPVRQAAIQAEIEAEIALDAAQEEMLQAELDELRAAQEILEEENAYAPLHRHNAGLEARTPQDATFPQDINLDPARQAERDAEIQDLQEAEEFWEEVEARSQSRALEPEEDIFSVIKKGGRT